MNQYIFKSGLLTITVLALTKQDAEKILNDTLEKCAVEMGLNIKLYKWDLKEVRNEKGQKIKESSQVVRTLRAMDKSR